MDAHKINVSRAQLGLKVQAGSDHIHRRIAVFYKRDR